MTCQRLLIQRGRGGTDLDKHSDGIFYHSTEQTSFGRAIDLIASRFVVEMINDNGPVRVPAS